MANRVYQFQLPYQISGIQDSVGIGDLQDAGLWDNVPPAVQTKLNDGAGWFSGGCEVTKADLDELPDDVWAFIATKLGLAWRPAATA